MGDMLDLDRVDEVCVRLAFSRILEGPAHDTFLLDARPAISTGRFDERPYLDRLEPVLRSHGGRWVPSVVHLNRTHRTWGKGPNQAEIVVALATGRSTTMEPAAVAAIGSVFRAILDQAGETPPTALDRRQALLEARLRVERGYAEVHADRLRVSDEEHTPTSGTWSVGLVLDDSTRFTVRIGFVDGDPRTTHVRRLPDSEVVDSLDVG